MPDPQQKSSTLSGTYHKPEGFRWLTLKHIKVIVISDIKDSSPQSCGNCTMY